MAEEPDDDERLADEIGAVAVIKIRRASKMSEEGRLAVAEWMREKASDLLSESHQWGPIMTLTYNPDPETET